MNILLLTSASPKTSPFYTSEKRPPLGLGFIMAVLKNAGHKVFFRDNYLIPSDVLDTDFLARNKIDFVGIYSNTICYQSTLEYFYKIQKMRLHNKWNGRIIVGGPHTSVGAETIPDFVDFIVIGEGEETILDIINGTVRDRIIQGKKVPDLDVLPMPAWNKFIDLPYDWSFPWGRTYPIYTMNTSRGCPFNCTFCSVKAVWGKTYRYMSAERVVHDVEYMQKKYGANGIYFREDHFTLNRKRTIEFCELLLKKNIKTDWLCETRVDHLDDFEYQALMARAGCKAFYIGVESGSQKMLDFFKKGERVEQFIKAFDIAHRVGIKTYASFVVAAPTETEEDLDKTYQLIERIKPDYKGMNVFTGLPGSELYDFVKENKLYEFEDENHILYLKGHNKLVDIFYKGDPYCKIPGSVSKCSVIKWNMRNYLSGLLHKFKIR
jgi:radical SAM superfamily enzyme YgiQ (UPF0313 family)